MPTKTLMNMESRIKILLIEDDRRQKGHIEKLLKDHPKFHLESTAENGNNALKDLKVKKIDLVIMDYKLGEQDLWGVELTRIIREKYPDIKILFWSAHINDIDIDAAKKAGSDGYVAKKQPDEYLLEAIDIVARGGQSWSDNEPKLGKKLTPTEEKVMRLLAKGKSTKQIAGNLLEIDYLQYIEEYGEEFGVKEYGEMRDYITVKRLALKRKAVEQHLHNIHKKLNIHGYGQLIVYAIIHYGLLEDRRNIQFSEKEIVVLVEKIEGKSIEQIAGEQNISEPEVRNILEKFGFDDNRPRE